MRRRGLSTAVAAGTLTVRQRLKSTPIDHRVLAHIQELGLGRRGVGNPRAQDAKLLRRRLQKRFGFVQAAHAPEELPAVQSSELAFAGRSNVGKSSLLNALLGKNCGPRGTIGMAAVENKPGSTRSVNFYAAPGVDGREVGAMLVDLPGYGFAKIADAQQADISRFLEAYLDGRRQLRGIVFLVDCRRDPNPEDMDIIQVLRSKNLPVVLVATKIDKLKSSAEFANSLNALEDFYNTEPLFFSSTTRQGRPELWARVNELLFSEDDAEEEVEWVLDDPPEEELSDASSEPAPLSDDDLLVF